MHFTIKTSSFILVSNQRKIKMFTVECIVIWPILTIKIVVKCLINGIYEINLSCNCAAIPISIYGLNNSNFMPPVSTWISQPAYLDKINTNYTRPPSQRQV